jgi:hypothetical protein
VGTPDELEKDWEKEGPWALKRDERTGEVLEEARSGFLEQLRQYKEQVWSNESKTDGWGSILVAFAVFVKERNLHDGVTYENGMIRWLGQDRGVLKVKRSSAVQFIKVAVNEWEWGNSKVCIYILLILNTHIINAWVDIRIDLSVGTTQALRADVYNVLSDGQGPSGASKNDDVLQKRVSLHAGLGC